LVEHNSEAAKLGWTCLGRISYKGVWQSTAWVWCKKGIFTLLTGEPNGFCDFIRFATFEEATRMLFEKRLLEEEAQRKSPKAVR